MSRPTLPTRKRKHLTLKTKIEVIKAAESDPRLTLRALAERFDCSKTQIGTTLKKKEQYLEQYESNLSSTAIQLRQKARKSKFEDVNDRLYEWYVMASSKNIYPGGPQLIEKAKEIAERLGINDFRGSNGWLQKWKTRLNLRQVTICGESGTVRGDTVQSWKERLPELLTGYSAKDIYNFDETGCFWKALPDKGFARRGEKCHGGKQKKHRMTVALFVNGEGGKETPIVVWQSCTPRCFKGINKASLPVKYFNQPKSWMTSKIFEEILAAFNRRMSTQNRSVLLLLDNAACHPPECQTKYSNVRLLFLPPNTTSKLQPLDLGIIQNFKVHYKKSLLRYVLAKIEESDTPSDVIKSVTILTAIRWVAKAWRDVQPDTIIKCFRNAGVLSSDMTVVRVDEADMFTDLGDENDLAQLMQETVGSEGCNVAEYIQGEENVPVCFEADDENWEDNFMQSLDQANHSDVVEIDSDSEDEDEVQGNNEEREIATKSFGEAMTSLEDVEEFLKSKGCYDEANMVASCVDRVAMCKCQKTKQKHILDYFS